MRFKNDNKRKMNECVITTIPKYFSQKWFLNIFVNFIIIKGKMHKVRIKDSILSSWTRIVISISTKSRLMHPSSPDHWSRAHQCLVGWPCQMPYIKSPDRSRCWTVCPDLLNQMTWSALLAWCFVMSTFASCFTIQMVQWWRSFSEYLVVYEWDVGHTFSSAWNTLREI